MTFTLTIDCDNAAFNDGDDALSAELASILRKLHTRIDHGDSVAAGSAGIVRDTNGNECGRWEIAE